MPPLDPAETTLLDIQDLKVYFPIRQGLLGRTQGYIYAVDGVSFSIPKGKTMGLVGESGSGKSTLGRSIIRLNTPTSGNIYYNSVQLNTLSQKDFFPYRKKIQMVFQDPFNSLNPRMTVADIISEPLEIHFKAWTKGERRQRVLDLLGKVGLDPNHATRYPHEFSGGQRQRIGIARALAIEPELIICDEPVSALDVSVQAQIINLLQDLQDEFELTYLFIAHDLAVVEHISDEIQVMHHGKIIESGTAEAICHFPQQPYTQQLLAAASF